MAALPDVTAAHHAIQMSENFEKEAPFLVGGESIYYTSGVSPDMLPKDAMFLWAMERIDIFHGRYF
jgi:hypothetical protein